MINIIVLCHFFNKFLSAKPYIGYNLIISIEYPLDMDYMKSGKVEVRAEFSPTSSGFSCLLQ